MSFEALHEDQMSGLDPLDSHALDFDWDELHRRLGETKKERADAIAGAARAWKEILRFCVRGNMNDPRYVKGAGLRVVALAWVISPEIFEGSPSLAALAERLGCTGANLSGYTAEFSRLFHVTNRAQKHFPGDRDKKPKDEQPSQN